MCFCNTNDSEFYPKLRRDIISDSFKTFTKLKLTQQLLNFKNTQLSCHREIITDLSCSFFPPITWVIILFTTVEINVFMLDNVTLTCRERGCSSWRWWLWTWGWCGCTGRRRCCRSSRTHTWTCSSAETEHTQINMTEQRGTETNAVMLLLHNTQHINTHVVDTVTFTFRW